MTTKLSGDRIERLNRNRAARDTREANKVERIARRAMCNGIVIHETHGGFFVLKVGSTENGFADSLRGLDWTVQLFSDFYA